MFTLRRCILPVLIGLFPWNLLAQCNGTCAPDAKQSSGAIYRVCVPPPSCYNGNLIIYAHGYVDVFKPVAIPEEQLKLPDGTSIASLINALGFGFATTSYRRNGLAVLEGVQDIRELVEIYRTKYGAPQRVFLVGPSEGGLVTAKSIETYPGVYAGGVAACGPVGDFRAQVNYVGDFRVLFDYFFPGVIPGNVTQVPQAVIDGWTDKYEPRIREAVRAKPDVAAQLVRTAKVPLLNVADIEDAIVRVAWYTVFANEDARRQLGGQPFDNIGRWYSGSNSDIRLNTQVQRVSASAAAIVAMQNYETSGLLGVPLVTLHTLGDPVIPYWHEALYRSKIERTGSGDLHVNLPVVRYGHCNFNTIEALLSLWIMLLKTGNAQPALQP